MKEEAFDVFVLYAFAFRQNIQDWEWGKIGYFCQLLKNFRNVVLLFELRLDKIFQSMNPKIDLLASVLLAQVHNVVIEIFGNVKIQQIVSHVQLTAQHDDSLIELIHFEKNEQMITVRFFGSVLKIIKNFLTIFFSS